MYPVDVGIRGDDHVVVAEAVQPVLNVQCGLKQVELLVLVHHLLGQAITVERLAFQREDRLSIDVPGLGDAAGGAVALCDEQGRLLGAVVLLGQVDPAVPELLVVEAGLLGPLPGELLDAGQVLALLLALEDALQQRLCGLRIPVQVVGELDLEEIVDKGAHARPPGADLRAAELGLGLGFEHRLLHADGNARHEAHADVAGIVFLLIEVADHLDVGLPERLLVGAPLRGVLAVDEAVVVFPVCLGVG